MKLVQRELKAALIISYSTFYTKLIQKSYTLRLFKNCLLICYLNCYVNSQMKYVIKINLTLLLLNNLCLCKIIPNGKSLVSFFTLMETRKLTTSYRYIVAVYVTLDYLCTWVVTRSILIRSRILF